MNEISPVIAPTTVSPQLSTVSATTDLWPILCEEARRAAAGEAMLARFLGLAGLEHGDLAGALAGLLARKLAEPHMAHEQLQDLVLAALRTDPAILAAGSGDLAPVC